MPIFDGNPRKWPGFINAFKVLIHDTCGNDMELLSHLLFYLVPELQYIIGESLGNPGLYPKTLRELQDMFGNPCAVAAASSTDMKNLPSFKDGDPLARRLFPMTLRSIASTLEIDGYGGELYANSTLQELEEKLRQILCDKWADYSSRIKHRLPNIMDFNAWIIEETKAKFSVRTKLLTFPSDKQTALRTKNSAGKSPRSAGGPRVHSTTGTDLKCEVCPGKDRVPDCAQFQGLSKEKRADVVKAKRLCFKCLGACHLAKECARKVPCVTSGCKSMHHPLMHDVPWLGPRLGKAAKAPRKPKDSSKPEAEKTEAKPFTGTMIITTGDTTPLLPIVAAILKSSKHSIRTFALLDTGSEATLIRQDIA